MNKPADCIDCTDPGDEVLRRFRFQMEFAALQAIALLRDGTIAHCIYCEQVEDILVELNNGRFIGKQVKTRELTQDPLKASDDVIEAALAHFCQKDIQFSGCFESFQLVTNDSFYNGDGGDSIRNLIACAKGEPPFSGLTSRSKVRQQIVRIAKRAGVTVDQALGTLAKLDLEEMHTGIDLSPRVTQMLSEHADFRQLPYAQLLVAAKLLVERMWAASSKAIHVEADANAMTTDIAARTNALTVANKRVDQSTVLACVREAAVHLAVPEQELLVIRDYLPRDGKPAGLSRMEAKMAAGNMSAMNVEQFKDDVRSAEATFLRWKERYDLREANRRLQHVQQLALQQCRKLHNGALAPDGFTRPIVTDVENLRGLMAQAHQKIVHTP